MRDCPWVLYLYQADCFIALATTAILQGGGRCVSKRAMMPQAAEQCLRCGLTVRTPGYPFLLSWQSEELELSLPLSPCPCEWFGMSEWCVALIAKTKKHSCFM